MQRCLLWVNRIAGDPRLGAVYFRCTSESGLKFSGFGYLKPIPVKVARSLHA
jgi:hypothetical protein